MSGSIVEKWQEILSVTMCDLSEETSKSIKCGIFCCGCALGKTSEEDKWISTILPSDYFLCEQCYQDEHYQAWNKQYIGVKCVFDHNHESKNDPSSNSSYSCPNIHQDESQFSNLLVPNVGWYVAQNSYLTFHCCNLHTEEERDQFLEKYQQSCVENNSGGVDEIRWTRFYDFKSHLFKLPANVPLMTTNHPSPCLLLDLEVADYHNVVKLPPELLSSHSRSWLVEIEALTKRWYSYEAVETVEHKAIEEIKVEEVDDEDNDNDATDDDNEDDDDIQADHGKETDFKDPGVRNYWNWITNIDGQTFRGAEQNEWHTLIIPSFGSLRAWIPFESFVVPNDSVTGRKITPQTHLYGSGNDIIDTAWLKDAIDDGEEDATDGDTIKFELFTFVYCDSSDPMFGQVAAGIFSSDTRINISDAYPDDCALVIHRMNLSIGEYLAKKTSLSDLLLPPSQVSASSGTDESKSNSLDSSGLLAVLPVALTEIAIGYCHSDKNPELLCDFWNNLATANAVRVCSLK